jgi:glycine cleavage system H protein
MRTPAPPFGLFVDDGHAWVRLATDGTLRLGVDDFLSEAVGGMQAVVLPKIGQIVARGEPLLRIKLASREVIVPAPASGEIVATNADLVASPGLLAHDPYGLGWAVSLRARDHKAAIAPLHVGLGASEFLRDELRRFLDLLTLDARREPSEPLLFADGGLPLRGALATCSPAAFERFQREFLPTTPSAAPAMTKGQ